MFRPSIAVVNSSSFGRVFPAHLAKLKRIGRVRRFEVNPRLSGRALARKLVGFQAVVASVSPSYDDDFFRLNRDLILISRHGIGTNNVDVDAATRHGVVLAKVAGPVEREAMAEHTIAMILAVARKIVPAHTAVARGRWAERMRYVGFELQGRTVGLIGFGNIGRRVGEMLVRGFGARVLARDPAVRAGVIRRLGGRAASLRSVLERSDVISLHASLNHTSYRILNAGAFRKMRRGVVIVNTARGELIDERAMVASLRSGRVSGFGADVVASEPAGRGHPYLKFPNVILVPHIGAYTVESLEAMGEKVLADVADVFKRRRRPGHFVNPDSWSLAARRLKRCR